MISDFWWQVVGAVMAGNFATVMFGYAIWYTAKVERSGGNSFRMPIRIYLFMIGPLALVYFVVSSLA